MQETFLEANSERTILRDGAPVNLRETVFDLHMQHRGDYAFLLRLLRALKVMVNEGHTAFDMGDDGITYFTRLDA